MIQFTKDDVFTESLTHGCNECTDGDTSSRPAATTVVMLDFRGAGETVQCGQGEYCESCAREIASRIKETLPDESEV